MSSYTTEDDAKRQSQINYQKGYMDGYRRHNQLYQNDDQGYDYVYIVFIMIIIFIIFVYISMHLYVPNNNINLREQCLLDMSTSYNPKNYCF